jgi:hypothetical protein
MTLADLSSLGSFVSGIAVVITLIFLLLQMRQANLNQRALMQQMRSARISELLLKATEPHLSETVNRAVANDKDIDATQITSFVMFITASLINWEDGFLQHRAGTLDESSFGSDIAIIKAWAALPSFRAIWQMRRHTFAKEYISFVDELVRNTKVEREPMRNENVFKELVTRELAAN